jgi:hypothetical protein
LKLDEAGIQRNVLPYLSLPCILEIKMTYAPRQFFGFTYRYWRSIAALADSLVHI